MATQMVWIVQADWHYEGSDPVRAFHHQVDAIEFQRLCLTYHETKPALNQNAEGEAWSAEVAKFDAWAASHPAGKEHALCDAFSYCGVPLGSDA